MSLFRRVAVFGVGLIGGSVGSGLKERGLVDEVVGVGRRSESLEAARARGLIDSVSLDPAAAFRGADLVLLAAPVAPVVELLESGLAAVPGRLLVTDACSTKAAVLAAAGKLDPRHSFVGGHPIAGSEQRGSAAADPDLFRDRVTVLTPTRSTSADSLARVRELWAALGSRVVEMDPRVHDRILALTSHLPHLLSVFACLAAAPALEAAGRDFFGSGFRDISRLAAGSDEVWRDIFLTNRDNLVQDLETLVRLVSEWRSVLERGDAAAISAGLKEAALIRSRLLRKERGGASQS